ncbi:hypothetical protein HK100_004404 [Physocladia obscura]|uniref:Fibronectin type-III domain-containing protein n=1 Tax=Physocladia obscura TaxID=109957 RepID=A0AAD5TCA4_9FUNG|nr:hypothetical protein HK100_004404 [Physocladia obscura]
MSGTRNSHTKQHHIKELHQPPSVPYDSNNGNNNNNNNNQVQHDQRDNIHRDSPLDSPQFERHGQTTPKQQQQKIQQQQPEQQSNQPEIPATMAGSAPHKQHRSLITARHAAAAEAAFAQNSSSRAPILQVVKTSARSVTLSWIFHPENTPPSGTPVQIVRAEGSSDPQFVRVYEGPDDNIVVDALKPETLYRFKMRVWVKDLNDFSAEFVETSAVTLDESKLVKVQLKLYRAVAENNVQAFNELMQEHGGEINIEMRDKNGKTMLMQAALKGTFEMVESILSHNALQTTTTQTKKTPLSLAVTYSNLPAVRALLANSTAAINLADLGGSTPLMWAVEHASYKNGLEIVAALLDAGGADVTREDANGMTALDRVCASGGSARCARMLIEHGAKIVNRVEAPRRKVTSLMMAALNGYKELCFELIDNWGADVWAKTEFGQTAKMMAEGAGYVELAALLEKRMGKEVSMR